VSQSDSDFENYISTVLQSRRNLGKAIVLCEGAIDSIKNVGVNPSMYRRLERVPDANFYTNCLPKAAQRMNRPQFYTCGSRNDVLKIYAELRGRALSLGDQSYVDPDKVFALVDLDIQPSPIENYRFECTESVFNSLYEGTQISRGAINTHKIFTTGLVHKEAYFFLSSLCDLYGSYSPPALFDGSEVSLTELHKAICLNSLNDNDVVQNFEIVKSRLEHLGSEFGSLQELVDFLVEDGQFNSEYILDLFLFGKAKPYWERIDTDPSFGVAKERFQEQLSMQIAKFYSEADDDNFHLTAILKSIYFQAYGIQL